jgi:hypothetical protein
MIHGGMGGLLWAPFSMITAAAEVGKWASDFGFQETPNWESQKACVALFDSMTEHLEARPMILCSKIQTLWSLFLRTSFQILTLSFSLALP